MDSPEAKARPVRPLLLLALRFGGIAGLIGGLWIVVAFWLHFYGGLAETAGVIVPIGAIVVGVMRWRDQVTGGATRFSSAFAAGLAIGLIYAATFALVFYVYVNLRHDVVVDQWVQVQIERMHDASVPQGQIDEAVANARPHLTAGFFAKQRFTFSLVVSLVVSLIAALVIPRRRIE